MKRRLTVAQAVVLFLQNQYSSRDSKEHRFIEGCFGIFGHGNVAGIGQALEQDSKLRYYLCRNEQAMVHTAAAFAKASFRMRNKPAASAAPAGRYFCAAKRGAGAAATGIRVNARYFCQRLFQAGLEVLGQDQSARATSHVSA